MMVYGLNVKPAHGYYVDVEALDGDPRQVRLVDDSPDGGLNPRGRHFSAGRPVKTEHMPTRMRWLDRRRHGVPDFDNGLVLNVSDRARALVERFEPGVHQFLPVEYVDVNDRHLENRWFLIVCNRLDSIDREHATMILYRGLMWRPASDLLGSEPDAIPPGFDTDKPAKLVFNSAQVGAAHMWCDKHLSGGTFISDRLAGELKALGLTGIRLSESGVEAV